MQSILPPSVILVLALSGLILYDILHQLALWIGRKSVRIHLLMSGFGAVTLVFLVGRSLHYFATTLTTARIAMCMEETAILFMLWLAVIVSYALARVKLPRLVLFTSLTVVVSMVVVLWSTDAFIQFQGRIWTDALGQSYYFLETGRYHFFYIPYGVLSFCLAVNVLRRSKVLLRDDLLIIFATAAAGVVTGSHDIFVGLQLISTPIVLEYGAASISLGLSFVTIRQFHRSRAQLERLLKQRSDVLEKTNLALQKAAEEASEAVMVKSRFLANMSHEIRTPMSGVIGMTEVLRRSELSQDHREIVEIISVSSKSLLTILDEILEFSEFESDVVQLKENVFQLDKIMKEAIEVFQGIAQKKGLVLEIEISHEVRRMVIGDDVRFKQVISNLVSNAVKYTLSGTITVTAKLSEEVSQQGTINADFIVQDTGIGISEEFHESIMHPFVQADGSTERSFGGTGLGLAIASQLVGRMGGRINVQSAPGQGSTFTFTLELKLSALEDQAPVGDAHMPVAKKALESSKDSSAVPLSADSSTVESLTLEGIRVLVAEDDPINQKVIRRVLKQLGCRCALARNGKEAMELFSKETYDVILMDCQMPIMGGYAATEAIRQKENESGGVSRIPIIALTAHALIGDREKCLASGMDEYLTKPVDIQLLTETIRSVVADDKRESVPPEPLKS